MALGGKISIPLFVGKQAAAEGEELGKGHLTGTCPISDPNY